MDFSKILALVCGILFIVILYFIIYYALKIMYKDIKGGNKKHRPHNNQTDNINNKKKHGLEVIRVANNVALKLGSIVPINGTISIGRKEDNILVLADMHVSSHHASINVQNEVVYLQDFNSTNGTYVNGTKINGTVKLFSRDEIAIGDTVFRVI